MLHRHRWPVLSRLHPRRLPNAIEDLLDQLEPFGVYADLKASLNLKADLPNLNRAANFGYIAKNGQFWTNPASWNLPDKIWRTYLNDVASAIGGVVIDQPDSDKYVAISGKSAPRMTDILPHQRDALVAAVERAIRSMHEADEAAN